MPLQYAISNKTKGNIRLSYTWDTQHHQVKTLQENHYYPFGLRHHAYAPLIRTVRIRQFTEKEIRQIPPEAVVYKYKYNGKELQDELGLNWYDYGARNYDAALGRFNTLDPDAEKYHSQSPYVYADNNPVRLMDIDGKGTEDEWIQFSTGETVKVGDKGGDKTDYITRVNKDGKVVTKKVDVKKSYVSISGGEIPRLIERKPGIAVYDATAPAIKENNIFFDILTMRAAGSAVAEVSVGVGKKVIGKIGSKITSFIDATKLKFASKLVNAASTGETAYQTSKSVYKGEYKKAFHQAVLGMFFSRSAKYANKVHEFKNGFKLANNSFWAMLSHFLSPEE